jgi:hypothetical protein
MVPTLDVVIPQATHNELGAEFYKNKIVLAFEGLRTIEQAKRWLALYNSQNTHELHIFDPLANGLFLVEVQEEVIPITIRRLLAQSPLTVVEHDALRASKQMITSQAVQVEDCKAAVNKFTTKFWASNLVDFRDLVYFQIKGRFALYIQAAWYHFSANW